MVEKTKKNSKGRFPMPSFFTFLFSHQTNSRRYAYVRLKFVENEVDVVVQTPNAVKYLKAHLIDQW